MHRLSFYTELMQQFHHSGDRQMKRIIRFTLISFFFFSSINTYAQFLWDEGGIPVRNDLEIAWQGSAISNSAGETYLIWDDCRNDIRSIFAQKYDIDGQALWQEGGINIGGFIITTETKPVIALTEDGFIVVWGQASQTGGVDIIAQRCDSDGNRLWGEEGLLILSVIEPILNLMMISDGASGALIVWDVLVNWETCDIYVQRIDSHGSIFPGWDPNGVLAAGGQDNSIDIINLDICSDGESGIILAWSQCGAIDIYAQRVDSAGELQWGGGAPVCTANGQQDNVQVIADGSGGVFSVWDDFRTAGGAKIFTQRLNSDGQPLWELNGIRISTLALEQSYPLITSDGAEGAFIAWLYGGYSDRDIYCQKIDSQGNILWNPSGIAICAMNNAQQQVDFTEDGAGGVYLVWADERNFGYEIPEIFAQHLNSNGQPVWNLNGILISEEGTWSVPQVEKLTDGSAFLSWFGWRGTESGIYIQKADAEGNLTFPVNGAPVYERLAGGTAADMRLAFLPPDKVISVWLDGRMYNEYNLYYQIYDMDGNIMLQENGTPATTGGNSKSEEQVTSTSDGGAVIVWKEMESSNVRKIRAQKIDSEGTIQWHDNGMQIVDWDHLQFSPKACSDTEGGAYIAFESYNGLSLINPDIYIQRVTADGNAPWGMTPTGITYDSRSKDLRGICEDGEGGAIVVWEWRISWPPQNDDIYASRILANGDSAWTRVICDLPSDQRYPHIISSRDGGAIIAWEDQRRGNWDIYAQKIDNDGNFLWDVSGVPVRAIDDNNAEHVMMVEDDEGFIFFIYEDGIGFGYRSLYCQRLDPAGNRLFPTEGILIADESSFMTAIDLAEDGQGGAYIIWDDDRNNLINEVYLTHVDANGHLFNQVWIEGGNALGDGFGRRRYSIMTTDGQGGAVFGWHGSNFPIMTSVCPPFDSRLYVQRVNDFVTSVGAGSADFIPSTAILYQNFPNPFNAVTKLSFDLPVSGKISLTLYNIEGQKVLTMIDGYRTAGRQEITLDASGMASGIYIVNLRMESINISKKIVLMK